MLKVLKCEETKKEDIKFDIYIPINIKFGIWSISKEPIMYYRIGDFSESLLEIGIGKYKKDIRSVTLTICKDVYEVNNCSKKIYNKFKGSPILELENTNDEIYIDEKEILKVYIENESICIMFSKYEISDCLQNGNVEFYLDSNKLLIGLRINNISKENRTIFKKALA